MGLLQSFIGKELEKKSVCIEENLLKRIFMAMNHPNQFDKSAQNQHIYQNKPLPAFILGTLIDTPKIYNLLGININNSMLSRESVTSHQPLYLGQTIQVKTILENAYEKQATITPIGFLILLVLGFHNQKLVFCVERILAIRGGFSRKGQI